MSARALLLHGGADGATLRIVDGRIAAGPVQADDLRIALNGDRMLPGLINAHDHLQLNALPRLAWRERHANVAEWIADIEPRLATDAQFIANAGVPRADRLLIGGIKNLLCGATTVAHHDPLYPALLAPGFPVRVLERYGWSHSLGLDGAATVRAAQRATPTEQPWIIHAAEGLDAAAGAEFDALEALGAIAANTVLVHGVALAAGQRRRLIEAGAGLVWCPASNLHLFGRTADVETLAAAGRLALGSDSRISGSRDLLDELNVARACSALGDAELEALVTERAAALLRLPDRGRLAPGRLGDVLVLPAGRPLARARRADMRLVLIGGAPRLCDPDYARAFGPAADLVPCEVDGAPKFLARGIAVALAAAAVREPGLTLTSMETTAP